MSNSPQKTEQENLSCTGNLLALAITIGVTILVGYIYGNNTLGGANNFDSLSDAAGKLMCVSVIVFFVVAGVVFSLLPKLMPGLIDSFPITPQTEDTSET